MSVTAAMGSLSLHPADRNDEEETIVYLGDDQPVVLKHSTSKSAKQNHQNQRS